MLVGVRGVVLRGGGGVGGGDVQNDGIDDKFMRLCDGSCSLCLRNFVVDGHMCAPVFAFEKSSGLVSTGWMYVQWMDVSSNKRDSS